MKKILSNILLGVILLSQTDLGGGLWMKTVCVDGYEFVVAYYGGRGRDNSLYGKNPGDITSYDGHISVNQVYEKFTYLSGKVATAPKQCGGGNK